MEIQLNKKSFCIFSYNSRGFGEDKKDLRRTLMMDSGNYLPILCNQENFLLHGNRYKVQQCLPKSRIFFKKAEKDGLHNGRAKNRMFIAIPMEFKKFAKEVNTFNWRTQALPLTFPENKIMIINSYFPTDPKVNEFDTRDLLCTLSAINDVLSNTDFDSLIWTGDINADFIRQTQFTKIIDEFIEEKALVKSWNKFPVDFTHSQETRNRTYTLTLDHFSGVKGFQNQ